MFKKSSPKQSKLPKIRISLTVNDKPIFGVKPSTAAQASKKVKVVKAKAHKLAKK